MYLKNDPYNSRRTHCFYDFVYSVMFFQIYPKKDLYNRKSHRFYNNLYILCCFFRYIRKRIRIIVEETFHLVQEDEV